MRLYVACRALYTVDRSAVIKFHDYAMVVAGSTVRRAWRYLLSPFNLRDLRNRHGRLQEQSEKQIWQITITEMNASAEASLSPLSFCTTFAKFFANGKVTPIFTLFESEFLCFIHRRLHVSRNVRKPGVHRSFALRYRFSNMFEQAAFPSEFPSDVRTYVAPMMMHTGI